MKKMKFELTEERKRMLKAQKKDNFLNRAVLVSLSPVVLAAVLLSSPITAVRFALNKKNAGAKESAKAAARGLVRPFKESLKSAKEFYSEGTQKLNNIREGFVKEDLKAAEAAKEAKRKEAEEAKRKEAVKKQKLDDHAAAEQKGVVKIASSIIGAKRVECITENFVRLGYKISFDNGVEMCLIKGEKAKPSTVCVFKSGEKEKYELNLSDYEYTLLAQQASEKIKLQLQKAKDQKLENMLNLLKEGQNIK